MGMTVNGYGIEESIERITKGVSVINTDHGNIHKQLGFGFHYFASSLAFGVKIILRITTVSDVYVHFKNLNVTSENGTISVKIIKDATVSAPGTEDEDAIQNLNHNSSNSSTCGLYAGAVHSNGVVWNRIVVPGNNSNQSSSSNSFIQSENQELVLKPDKEYIIEIENIDDDEDTANNILLKGFFYEEEEGVA